jgi:MFS family permease
MKLTAQYNAIYAVGLGANSVTLGTISSIGSGISALISTPVGWLVDRFGVKSFYLLAIGLLSAGALTYAIAPTWEYLILATILFTVSMRLTGTGCSVICADSVANKDRVTAQNVCVTLSSIASLIAPLIAAHFITLSGGLNSVGIRPLYYVRAGGYALIFLLIATQLKEPRTQKDEEPYEPRFIDDFRDFLSDENHLKGWIILSALTSLPMAITTPFLQLYAHEIKGADQYVLGIMSTAMVLTRLVFGIPLGRLADRLGRKKIIYLTTPLWYASSLLLAFSLNSVTLIIAGALQTFYSISSGITSAMMLEVVPIHRMGKWNGVLGLFRGLVTIPAPVIGGLIWQGIGPIYVFLIPLVVDLCVRIPLLNKMPETLEMEITE